MNRVARRVPTGALVRTGAVALAFVVWFALAGSLDPMRFPTPTVVWDSLRQLLGPGYAGGTLLAHTLVSIKLALLGFVVATVTAVPLGLAMGCNRVVEAAVEPIVALIRPIPPLAWIPLAILWFGLGDGAKIFVIWFTAFVPTLINTFLGVRRLDRAVLSAARTLGANRRTLLVDVVIPGAAPYIFAGLRISLQASWMALVAAELIGAFFGLGRVLMMAAQDIHPGMIVVAMAMVGLAGAAMTGLLAALERRCLTWRGAA